MDIICFSHIRWNFVYQRPQHLLNRFAVNNRVFVIEEPVFDTSGPEYYEINKVEENKDLWVVNLHCSRGISDDHTNHTLKGLLDSLLYANDITKYITWYYTPMALAYSDHLEPIVTIYDCMDELSAFKFAPQSLKSWEQKLLSQADVVFTGGYSLYNEKKHLHHNIYPFPSSIDYAHFLKARNPTEEPLDQASIPHPRFGFYGVIDERFHLSLINELSKLRPDWHFILVGPIAKIDPSILPKGQNIYYTGGKQYDELPRYLAGWDVAILPFELNDSTKFISPTKTPEYLAGGKPVISTSITDVVNPYAKKDLVEIADTPAEFIKAAEKIFNTEDKQPWLRRVDDFLSNNSWDQTWKEMVEIIKEAMEKKPLIKNNKKQIYV
ncbi:glycosyltransferase family 1 protein [Hanamia caeni]|uniref:Glycosyltransferase family 1 protein n=1 Tax=Hanamia caeni TaxID=2294116 RepID=A0A3M9N8K5_9BACT|nr:glycosyltransferase family 1 protein [Hanamia caeni]RNI34071.1 glycosyltransferase family 1 protein [Hanamia caeni]